MDIIRLQHRAELSGPAPRPRQAGAVERPPYLSMLELMFASSTEHSPAVAGGSFRASASPGRRRAARQRAAAPVRGPPNLKTLRGRLATGQDEPQLMASPTRLIVVQRPSQPLEFVCARLRAWGCELYGCQGHGEAMAALAGGAADLVLIDAWVEVGMALLTQIKADPRTRYLPVVIATRRCRGGRRPCAGAGRRRHADAAGRGWRVVRPHPGVVAAGGDGGRAPPAGRGAGRVRPDGGDRDAGHPGDQPGREPADRARERRQDPGDDRARRRRHRRPCRDRRERARAPAPRRSGRCPDHHQPRSRRAAAPVRRDPLGCSAVRPAGPAGRPHGQLPGPLAAVRVGGLGRSCFTRSSPRCCACGCRAGSASNADAAGCAAGSTAPAAADRRPSDPPLRPRLPPRLSRAADRRRPARRGRSRSSASMPGWARSTTPRAMPPAIRSWPSSAGSSPAARAPRTCRRAWAATGSAW